MTVEKEEREITTIDISNIPESDRPYLKIFFKLAASPEKFNFAEVTDHKESAGSFLKVEEINFSGYNEAKEYTCWIKKIRNWFNLISRKKIRIPVKRFVAKSRSQQSDILPAQVNSKNETLIILLGGAEQNLGSLELIAEHKWQQKNPSVGIAENVFDNPGKIAKFQVGAENLVYSCRAARDLKMVGRKVRGEHKGKAELFSFKLNNLRILSIYGYSAAMTKISLTKFLLALKQGDSKKIPWKHPDKRDFETLMYLADDREEDFYSSDMLQFWDDNDIINQKLERLIILLEQMNLKVKYKRYQ